MANTEKNIESQVAELINIVADLSERVKVLEAKPEPEVHHPHRVRGMNEILKAELKSLVDDPDSAIEAKMKYGLTREQASIAVQKRIAHLKQELGVKKKSDAKKAAALIALLAFLALTLFGVNSFAADQQGYPQTYTALSNLPAPVFGGSVSNNINSFVKVAPGKGLGIQWQFQAAAATNSGNVSLFMSPSTDGTNIDAGQLWLLTRAANGSNVVTADTNWTRGQLDGYKAIVIVTESNNIPGTNSSVTNLPTSLSNLPNN